MMATLSMKFEVLSLIVYPAMMLDYIGLEVNMTMVISGTHSLTDWTGKPNVRVILEDV
jgi:hypothetical protein